MVDAFSKTKTVSVASAGGRVLFEIDDPADEIQKFVASGKFYELDQLVYHRGLIPHAAHILDVGANIGNHSLFYAACCGARRIDAFEPNPRALRLFIRSVSLNGWNEHIQVHPFALGRQAGFGTLDEREAEFHNLGGVSVRPSRIGPAGPVAIRPGDELFSSEQIDFIKIDVEGSEIDVLLGLRETILKSRPVMSVEVTASSLQKFRDILAELDYSIERTFRMYRNIYTFVVVPWR